MAKIMLRGTDELVLKLSRLESGSSEIAKKAIYKGAGIMADQIKSNLQRNLSGSDASTGDLAGSLGITTMKQSDDGNWNVRIGFDGYDRNGVPNQLKARAMESGTSKQRKKPFVRPAISQARERAKQTMQEVIEEEIERITGG